MSRRIYQFIMDAAGKVVGAQVDEEDPGQRRAELAQVISQAVGQQVSAIVADALASPALPRTSLDQQIAELRAEREAALAQMRARWETAFGRRYIDG